MKLTLGKLIWVADSTATMLEAGLPITRVLDVLVNQASGRARRALQKARAEIDAGATLAEALASSGVFPALFLRLVEVGEESGKLERTTQELQRLYAFQRRLRRGFLGGVAFPALQYVLAIAIMAAVTAVLGSFGIRLGNPALIVALGYGVPAVLVTAYLLAVRWIATARIVHEMTLHLPVVGGVARSVALARFSLVMHLCLEAGMPVTEAIRRALQATGNGAFAARAGRIIRAIEGGADLTDALARTSLFPGQYLEITRVAEESGKLSERFEWLASHHEDRARAALTASVAVLSKVIWIAVAIVMVYFIFRLFSVYMGAIQGALGR